MSAGLTGGSSGITSIPDRAHTVGVVLIVVVPTLIVIVPVPRVVGRVLGALTKYGFLTDAAGFPVLSGIIASTRRPTAFR